MKFIKKSIAHINSQNESYFEHMRGAWKICYTLKVLEIKCLIHSIFPFLYTDAVSSNLECLEKMVNRSDSDLEIEEDLYETYGGD
tara:strand:+ start:731 stop:985 length:255 start_codon:yes stop_codon:yes gene_type:complete